MEQVGAQTSEVREKAMTQPTVIELVEQLRKAATVPEMARLVALIMREAGIHNFQQVAYELARISVTDRRLGNE